jgi:hypothetical protein
VNVDSTWSKLSRVILVLLFMVSVLLVGVWYLPLIRQNEAMRKEDLRLDGEIRKEEDIVRGRKATIDALKNDPKTVERLAREKLGLARTGETIVHFEAPWTNPPPTGVGKTN